jgi:hypothetical protein
MIDNFVRDLHVLWKADSLIGRIWLNLMARRFGLLALAGLVAVFGLAMANVAGFYGLEPSWGAMWAAAIVAVGDFLIAAAIMVLSRTVQTGPEMELAFELRRMAVASLETDARDLKNTFESFGQELRQAREGIAGLVQHPMDALTDRFLVPAALAVIKGLRAKKGQA